jgi:hypothetical protein
MSGDKPTVDPVPELESAYDAYPKRMPPRAWLMAAAFLTLGLFAGFSIASDSVPPAPLPGDIRATDKPTGTTVPGNGTFWVGTDVTPGLYHSYQNTNCQWSRSKDATGEARAVLAEDTSHGDTYVLLQVGDFFDTAGCTTWTKVKTDQ